MSELQNLIDAVISEYNGSNDEFCLAFFGSCGDLKDGSRWEASIGNLCEFAHIGESGAELSRHGFTPEDAVRNLLSAIRGKK